MQKVIVTEAVKGESLTHIDDCHVLVIQVGCKAVCCGSMTFWSESRFAYPCLWLMDPDPDIFVIDLGDANENLIFVKKFFCLLLFEVTFIQHFSKYEVKKKSQNISYYFCLMIEGSGSVPLTRNIGTDPGSQHWYKEGVLSSCDCWNPSLDFVIRSYQGGKHRVTFRFGRVFSFFGV